MHHYINIMTLLLPWLLSYWHLVRFSHCCKAQMWSMGLSFISPVVLRKRRTGARVDNPYEIEEVL